MPRSPVVWQQGPWLSLGKPAGVPVLPYHHDPGGDCLLARLLAARPEQGAPAWPERFPGGIAHRLDISTSGQVLAATSVDALVQLRGLFSSGELVKRYVFVTAKDVPWSEHTVAHRLAHDRRRKSRMVFERGRKTPHRGKWLPAETKLRRLGPCGSGLTLWEATMSTGVMHQIRVHAASAGLALVGDRLYGGGEPVRDLPDGVDFLLHHTGLRGPELSPPPLPTPPWWPRQADSAAAGPSV